MMDLSQKVRKASRALENNNPGGGSAAVRDQQLDKVVRGGQRIVSEEVKGLLASEVKMKLFQGIGDQSTSSV
jgi:COP9 signalosome complex subunit 5